MSLQDCYLIFNIKSVNLSIPLYDTNDNNLNIFLTTLRYLDTEMTCRDSFCPPHAPHCEDVQHSESFHRKYDGLPALPDSSHPSPTFLKVVLMIF